MQVYVQDIQPDPRVEFYLEISIEISRGNSLVKRKKYPS